MKQEEFRSIFNDIASELHMHDYKLALTMEEYRRLTGRHPRPKNRRSGECNFTRRVIYVWPHFYVNDVDEMNEDLAKAAIYHELTHAKHPRMSESRVGETSRALVWPHLRKV